MHGRRHPQRTLTLGDAETVSIDDARGAAARARRAVAAGNDPLEDRRAAVANRSQEARYAARSAEAQAAMLAAILARPRIGRSAALSTSRRWLTPRWGSAPRPMSSMRQAATLPR